MDSETPSFSTRHGFEKPAKPITIRNEAPLKLRHKVLGLARATGVAEKQLRLIICSVLGEVPQAGLNWGSPNVMMECQTLLENCEWFEVYDICEAIERKKREQIGGGGSFEQGLNSFFISEGIGWKMEDGIISIRGEEDYEKTTHEAKTALEKAERKTAAGELQEAQKDLARRPEADITGAIQHSMAALECLAKDLNGGSTKTLGDLIKGLNLPTPVDHAVEKMWGFASNQGRHITEGKTPAIPEAMLTVHFCSAIISYLSQKK